MSIIQLLKAFLLAFILCENIFASASSGLQSGLHRARSNSRASRHSPRSRTSYRHRRQRVCIPDDEVDDEPDTDEDYGYDTEEKRDLSPSNQSYQAAWEDADSPIQNSTFESFPANATVGNITIAPSDLGNFTEAGNSSHFNTSLPGNLVLTGNVTSIGFNQSQESNSTDSPDLTSSLLSELPHDGMKKSDLFLGFLPDDGAAGGTRQTMAQLNSAVGSKAAVYGWYAQAHSGVPFDGSQLLYVIDDVKACNCVFQPAVMPIGGWQGLTSEDNSQAVAIANVMKKFTDEGIPVWLRFAHEVNYYQTDGTYQGTAADFKAGWAAVSDAIKKIAPSVKMWWTPNVSSAEDYAQYEPDDMSTVDLVGIDYYPKKLTGSDFLDVMKDFHDKYAVDGRKFAIGETGLGWSGSLNDKVNWFNQICDAKASMPHFLSMAWFNFDKEYDYKLAGEPTLNQKFTSLIAT